MKLRAIAPLVTYPDPHPEAAAAGAAAVAALLGADLHALALEVDIPPVSNTLSRMLLSLPEMIADTEKASARNGRTLLAAAKAGAADGVAVTSEVAKAQPALMGEEAARHARYFDLALIGWASGNPGISLVAEAVLFGAGRPLLLFPADAVPSAPLDHIAIAWDGSAVAARALADARPLVARAKRVSVVTVTDEKRLEDRHAGEKLVAALQVAGVDASLAPAAKSDRPIAARLQGLARDAGADLLVMGGFGHSRLRDFVLGGATAGVLGELAMPVFLSH